MIQDQAITQLAADLAAPDRRTRQTAADALRSNAHRPDVRDALIESLELDDDAKVRASAVWGLGLAAANDPVARRALLDRLGPAPHADVRREREPHEAVRHALVKALGEFAGTHADIRDALLARIEDRNSNVRAAALDTLGAFAGHTPEVRAVLIDALDSRGFDRIVAAKALGALADGFPDARAALLTKLTQHTSDSTLEEYIAAALGPAAASHPDVRASLVATFADPAADGRVRRAAVDALGPLAESHPDVREALIAAGARDPHAYVREAANQALAPAVVTSGPILRSGRTSRQSPRRGGRDGIG